MTDLATHRAFYADLVTSAAKGRDARVFAAFREVPRERFFGPGPWRIFTVDGGYISTPNDDPVFVYQDTLVALDEARGINNGLPSLHARCLNAVLPRAGETVIHVGGGSGYYSAILAHLVGKDGTVETFEIEPELAARCARNLADRPNVRVRERSALSPPLDPADVIYVCAGLPFVPALWLDALRPGGRLILPLTPGSGWGAMLKVTRHDQGYAAAFFAPAMFIPCVATSEADAIDILTAAFGRGDSEEVRSLRRSPEPPDDSCWLAGEGWWLSTKAP
jgi:protein-L-isoaspartate(D-aspartate) O-methyltransferase